MYGTFFLEISDHFAERRHSDSKIENRQINILILTLQASDLISTLIKNNSGFKEASIPERPYFCCHETYT